MDFGIGQITIGGGAVAAVTGLIWKFFRRGRKTQPASIERGVKLLEAGMLEIRAAVADLPAMKDTQARHDIDIRHLRGEVQRLDNDITDVRRVAADLSADVRSHESRIRRLEVEA